MKEDKMKVSEAIQIQEGFIARKYHIYRFSNQKLKESMKTLTKAYSNLWTYLKENYPDILDDYLINLED